MEPCLVPYAATSEVPTLDAEQRGELLAAMRDWDYGEGGVFQRDKELGGHALFHTTAEGIHHFDLCEKLAIDPGKLHNWILSVERCMRPDSEVPYHNAVHVCDVVHAAWWFLEEGRLADLLTPRATLAILLAACAHDTGHPGLNNSWWTDTELGRTYHGRSPLENFHIRQGLELMRHDDSDVLAGMGEEDRTAVRTYMIDAILDTDLVYRLAINRHCLGKHLENELYHNKCCEQFQRKLDKGESFSRENEADQSLLVNMCLKSADIANPAKSWQVYSPWIDRLFKEFYAQGDLELQNGKTPAPFMNRRDASSSPPKAQQGFITYLMRPLMVQWARLVPKCAPLLKRLDVNLGLLKKWESEIEAERASK